MEIIDWNDSRNLRDCYKGKDETEIFIDREGQTLPYYVALMNLTSDFNKSSAIRNANNFLARGVTIVGKRKWDRRGAVGSHNYMRVTHLETLQELRERLPNHTFVAMENAPEAQRLDRFRWDMNSVMVFGEEQRGLSDEELALCDYTVSIPTMGTVRSLNVAVASGIAMYDYCNKMLSLV